MALKALSTPGFLEAVHADGFERVRLALHLAGIKTGTTDPWHAMRTLADQIALFKKNYTTTWVPGRFYWDGGIKDWDGRTWYRRPYKPVTAIPGTSNHGNGDTVDFQGLGKYDSATWKRADAILREHGWNNTEGRKINEPWHWTRVTANDKHRNDWTLTVSEYTNIMAKLNGLVAKVSDVQSDMDALRADSAHTALSTNVIKTTDPTVTPTPVQQKVLGAYAQATLFGIRHIIKQLDRIIKKIGA